MKYTFDDLLNLFEQTRFIVFISILVTLWIVVICVLLATSKTEKVPILRLICYGTLSGSLGGCQFIIKTFVEVVKQLFKDISVLAHFSTYLIALGTVICCVGQVLVLNRGLKYYPSLHMLPLYQGTFIVVGSISGIVFFGEYNRMIEWQWVVYPIGMVLTVIGLFYTALLSKRDEVVKTDKHEDELEVPKKKLLVSNSSDYSRMKITIQ